MRNTLIFLLNLPWLLLSLGCGTMYREPNGYNDMRLPVAGTCNNPDIAISPYGAHPVDVHGIPYGMVVTDPANGREFRFLRPEPPRNYPISYPSNGHVIPDSGPNPSSRTFVNTPVAPVKSQEEIQNDARRNLVASLALRMGANNFEPETGWGVAGKMLAMGVGSSGIEESLAILMPDASETERVVVKAVLIAFADLKITPEQISLQVTKDVFMAELAKQNPAVARNLEVASTAWEFMDESIKAANKQQ